MITQKELKRILYYNPETGIFIWLFKNGNHIKMGDIAGSIDAGGYIIIKINGKQYKAHRLAWLYITSFWPKNDIDHKDQVRNNNIFSNLRDATHQINSKNKSMSKNNTSGFAGVTFHKATKKWLVQIKVNYRQIYLGVYKDINEAIKIRKQANIMYGFYENHGLKV